MPKAHLGWLVWFLDPPAVWLKAHADVEAAGTLIRFKDPERNVAPQASGEIMQRGGDERAAGTCAPVVRINVEGRDLRGSLASILVTTRRGGTAKSHERPVEARYEHSRVLVPAQELTPQLCSPLQRPLSKPFFRDQPAVGGFPAAHVHSGDRTRIFRIRAAYLHPVSVIGLNMRRPQWIVCPAAHLTRLLDDTRRLMPRAFRFD